MSTVKFTATKLVGSNKQGILKPDADGYYEMVIGGLNVFNSAGEYYTLSGAKELFEASSIFMRRVKNGCLKGEEGHPKKLPTTTNDQFLQRIFSIEETNVCAHFSEVWLDETYGAKNPQFKNKNLVAIMAKVKPAGPKSASLAAALENPKENVCFSIRAITKDYYERGQCFRVLERIVCFDRVNEPGINIANKWDSPAMEALVEQQITKRMVERVVNDSVNMAAMESTHELAIDTLRVFSSKSLTGAVPLYSKW